MKWVSDYRPGAIEEAFVSLWCRCVLFGLAIWFGSAVAVAILTRGVPTLWESIGPIPCAMVMWLYYPRYLLLIGLTMITFVRTLQTESTREAIICMASVAAAWAWITLSIFG